jgi:hypothetical protein
MDEFCMHHMPKKALVFLKLSTAGESPTAILLKKGTRVTYLQNKEQGGKRNLIYDL